MGGEWDSGCVNSRVTCSSQKQPSPSQHWANVCPCKSKEWRNFEGAVKTWKIITDNEEYGEALFREKMNQCGTGIM